MFGLFVSAFLSIVISVFLSALGFASASEALRLYGLFVGAVGILVSPIYLLLRWPYIMRLPTRTKVLGLIGGFGLIAWAAVGILAWAVRFLH